MKRDLQIQSRLNDVISNNSIAKREHLISLLPEYDGHLVAKQIDVLFSSYQIIYDNSAHVYSLAPQYEKETDG